MMVNFISQCEKNALKKTRRVLDAFADRIGDNTWQTVITKEGLDTVKKMLRKTASKSTAVSCHWIRSRSRSHFLWVVGNKARFNDQGVVPVNSTQINVFKKESDWHYLPLIKALAALAGLLHDWGKATSLFQTKLKLNSMQGDPIRHEWISCILLNALVTSSQSPKTDEMWLMELFQGRLCETTLYHALLSQKEQNPLTQLPPAATLLAWLIVSHHRLPCYNPEDFKDEPADNMSSVMNFVTKGWGYENKPNAQDYEDRVKKCFEFPNGLMSASTLWMKQLKKWAKRLHECLPKVEQCMHDGSHRIVLHHARLSLMLGDHYYSSQPADKGWPDTTRLYANTDRLTRIYKQKLDEHLTGVARNALHTAHLLSSFESDPPVVQGVLSLRKPSPQQFHWQNKAVEKIFAWKKDQDSAGYGFFAVNMASTGCGKTFANAKIMRALSNDGDSLRYVLALGLRTLTLQTGEEYRQRIGLDDSELAVLIGSKAILELHNRTDRDDKPSHEHYGSESEELLMAQEVDYGVEIPEEGLATVLKRQQDRQLLYSPVLACTIDHIMGATETRRGGRYILPCLRLMSSDLVIDEVDDFTGSDLIAIGRLIHLSGMLGRKVMISSATIPPDLAEGYFHAYLYGWQIFSKTRSAVGKIGCAWVDEFQTNVAGIDALQSNLAVAAYRKEHQKFVEKRIKKLKKQPARRKGRIIQCQDIIDDHEICSPETKKEQYFGVIKKEVLSMHEVHSAIDSNTGVSVSFGLIRMANIVPCVSLARYLMEADWPDDVDVKVMAYHSQQVLLLRHEQEKHLDKVLKRKEDSGSEQLFEDIIIRNHLKNTFAKHLIFILVATPVEEVGRDHDFDWAIVEPSSYRSIIQLAGRVLRHRGREVKCPNIGILQYNWKAIKDGNQPGKKCFIRPGYEEKAALKTHDLNELIDAQSIAKNIDAVPRIHKPQPLNYRTSLVGLEHAVIQQQLANYKSAGPEKLLGYLKGSWYLTALPQVLNPFRKGEQTKEIFLMSEPGREQCIFIEKDEDGLPQDTEKILQISHDHAAEQLKNRLWMERDYTELLEQYAQEFGQNKKRVSLRFGGLNFPYRENNEYTYSDQFGLVQK